MAPWLFPENKPKLPLACNRIQKTEGTCNANSAMDTQSRELRVTGRQKFESQPSPSEPLSHIQIGMKGFKELLRQPNKYMFWEMPKPVHACQTWLAQCL